MIAAVLPGCCHAQQRPMLLQGVANRDIKLENTLLDGSPRPLLKICDFGYSKVIVQLSHLSATPLTLQTLLL